MDKAFNCFPHHLILRAINGIKFANRSMVGSRYPTDLLVRQLKPGRVRVDNLRMMMSASNMDADCRHF